MRAHAAKKISQLRRRRRMLGRKLLPKLKGVLQAGRIAKPIHTSRQWTVTPISQVDESLVRAVPSISNAISTRARKRGSAADVEHGAQNTCRGLEESRLDSSQLDRERRESHQCGRRRKKRRAAAVAITPQAEPASEEDESPDGHSGGSGGDDDDEDSYEEAIAASGDPSSGDEDVSNVDSGSASNESESAGMADVLQELQSLREDHDAVSPVESDDEQWTDEEDTEVKASADGRVRIFVAPAGRVVMVVFEPPSVVRLIGRAQVHVLHGMIDLEGLILACAEVRQGRLTTAVVQSGFPVGPAYVRPLPFGPPTTTLVPLRRALTRLGLEDTWPQLRRAMKPESAVVLFAKVPGGEWPIDLKSTARLRGPYRALGFKMVLDDQAFLSSCHPWRSIAGCLGKDLIYRYNSPEGRLPTPHILVCGRQNSGKSSVLRVLINSFISLCKEVLYLDCDPGQCEFTPPATVSLTRVTTPLMGPPFTHVRTPMKAYFLGHVSPASQPDAYCEAVHALIEHARQVAPRTPLFINTMGWTSGLGASLLVDVIRWSRPTDVVQLLASEGTTDLALLHDDLLQAACGWMTSRDGSERYPPLSGVKYHRMPGSVCRGRSWARLKRETMVLAYLGQHIGTGLGRPLPEACHWLWNTVPMRVPWSALAVHDCDNVVPKKELLHCLRGSVVALCVVPNDKLLETEDPTFPKFVNDCGPYECLGYGLVRAIDPSERVFYIISPEPRERLTQVNALVRGDLHLPESLLTTQAQLLHCGSSVPYVANTSCDLDQCQGSTSRAEDTADDTSYC